MLEAILYVQQYLPCKPGLVRGPQSLGSWAIHSSPWLDVNFVLPEKKIMSSPLSANFTGSTPRGSIHSIAFNDRKMNMEVSTALMSLAVIA